MLDTYIVKSSLPNADDLPAQTNFTLSPGVPTPNLPDPTPTASSVPVVPPNRMELDSPAITHGGRRPKGNKAPPSDKAPTSPARLHGSVVEGLGSGSTSGPSRSTLPDLSSCRIDNASGPPGRPQDVETREITVETQHERMTRSRLNDLFHTNLHFRDRLTPLARSDITGAWEEENPPRFELSSVDIVRRAIELYSAEKYQEFGVLTIKAVTRSVAEKKTSDGKTESTTSKFKAVQHHF